MSRQKFLKELFSKSKEEQNDAVLGSLVPEEGESDDDLEDSLSASTSKNFRHALMRATFYIYTPPLSKSLFRPELVIERLKSLTSTGAKVHATPLSIGTI